MATPPWFFIKNKFLSHSYLQTHALDKRRHYGYHPTLNKCGQLSVHGWIRLFFFHLIPWTFTTVCRIPWVQARGPVGGRLLAYLSASTHSLGSAAIFTCNSEFLYFYRVFRVRENFIFFLPIIDIQPVILFNSYHIHFFFSFIRWFKSDFFSISDIPFIITI